ncbi:MAG: hypothetical protein Q7U66_14710 [Methylobacter sp.]|nr:hypothetical protein [Methylobacter sp.]
MDEFALQSTPYTHYAWAEKNTKPKIWSDECHRQKLNGFLTVDVQRGSTRVDFKKQSSTETVVGVVVLTVLVYLQQGFRHLTFLLDNAKIHGKKNGSGCASVACRNRATGGTAGVYPELLAYTQLLATPQPCRIPDP